MTHERWTDSPLDPKRMPPLFRPLGTAERLRGIARYLGHPRRLLCMAAVLAALASGFLGGCAPTGYWVKTREPMPSVHIQVERYADLVANCRADWCGFPACVLHGCAVRGWAGTHYCAIFTQPEPPRWIYRHELAHCEGWDHPTSRLLLSEWPDE